MQFIAGIPHRSPVGTAIWGAVLPLWTLPFADTLVSVFPDSFAGFSVQLCCRGHQKAGLLLLPAAQCPTPATGPVSLELRLRFLLQQDGVLCFLRFFGSSPSSFLTQTGQVHGVTY